MIVLSLAACGFKPLYGNHPSAVSQQAFSRVKIGPLSDRVGQLLHAHLTKSLHAGGNPKSPLWELSIDLKSKIRKLGIRKDETATRANLTLEAKFQLKNIRTGKVEFRGLSVVTNSYNILKSRFGTIASENDAFRRGARELGDNIKTRVAIFLTSTNRRP